jgi:predicted ArsR family transcriptional regulator
MREATFFQTTRGRIIEALKRRGPLTASELSKEHGLTANAIRQHLARLERDGLVLEASARRGPTKPSLIFSLTPAGERLFPQRYGALLNAVLDELRAEDGEERISALFHNLGKRSAHKYASRFAGKGTEARVAELTKLLREQGVVADFETTATGFVLREHNCPFKDTAVAHPQVCSVVHTLMEEVLPAAPTQRTSIARGDATCEFVIPSAKKVEQM